MNFARQLALWADRLRDISGLGLHFAREFNDREHFKMVQDISLEMMAAAAGRPPQELEPLRGEIFARPTPLCGGDAGIVDEAGRILLIRRADNGLWAMPGGAMCVGETPAEGAAREAFEETGVRCRPVLLAGVHDSRLCGTRSTFHIYHFLFLCRPLEDGRVQPASHAHEARETAWFREDALPADLDPGHAPRIPAVFRAWHGERRAYFDGQSVE